jgi:choline dehydrogenase
VSFDLVLPYFKKAETNTRGANEWHGNSGPITVKPSRLDLPICEAFLGAAGEAGFSVVDDLYADVAEGFGRFDTNIANGRRASTAVAYVQPARRCGNLELLSETIAARIVIEGSRAGAVEIVRDRVRETTWHPASAFSDPDKLTRQHPSASSSGGRSTTGAMVRRYLPSVHVLQQ